MSVPEEPSQRQIEHIHIPFDQSLEQAIIAYAKALGIPNITPWGKGILVRRINRERVAVATDTGTDRDASSDTTHGQYENGWPIAQAEGLAPAGIILLAEVLTLDALYTPEQEAVTVYDPNALRPIPGTVLYTPREGLTFSDALVAIFSREAPPDGPGVNPVGSFV